MNTELDVRNVQLYASKSPSEIWRMYVRALDRQLDRASSGRADRLEHGDAHSR